ncbi:chondroitinase B-like protein [Terracoccus luteus]|uniref:Chondroitinase B-like protein n=1 Tax=Terracoccus luteus TaxID=53356 RepID=A0A495Y2V5_9MICO|nr:right-handed parallel beta-helix repeat-containing protein [Terracoccus luteus]RKT79745.1 chondroitinase B-like protein [Terracoccus luteus]
MRTTPSPRSSTQRRPLSPSVAALAALTAASVVSATVSAPAAAAAASVTVKTTPRPAKGAPGPVKGGVVDVSTSTQLHAAVKSAKPGDTIRLAPGTYTGPLDIRASGTAEAPITLTGDGTGEVRLTADLRMPACNATAPDPDRTIRFTKGASHWTITGLSIRGGVMIMGGNAGNVRDWLNRNAENWQARRAVPGRASYEPTSTAAALEHLQGQVRVPLRPSVGIRIVGNDLTLKGIHSAMNDFGLISGNEIHDIACGTGPGVWLGTFSDGWRISDNDVHDIAPSTWKHYMQEGIRVGGSSAYNTVTGNVVHDLPGDGRAFTTDEDGSWNTISFNTARDVAIGLNDQKAGWGNRWVGNRVENARAAAISLRAMDSRLTWPSMNSSTRLATVACNTVSGSGVVFQAGATMSTTVSGNTMSGAVQLAKPLRSYWPSVGNTWNGSTAAPGTRVDESGGAC